jgi:hypothetical protein
VAGLTFGAPAGTVTISPQLREQLAHFDIESAEPVDVIITLSSEPAAISPNKSTQLNRIRTERGNVFSQLRRNGVDVSPKHEFELAINGFSITSPPTSCPCSPSKPGSWRSVRPRCPLLLTTSPTTRPLPAQAAVLNGLAEALKK